MCLYCCASARLCSVRVSVSVLLCFNQALFSACEENDVDAFTEALRNYDSVSRLDPWHTNMLLRVKKSIEGESDLL